MPPWAPDAGLHRVSLAAGEELALTLPMAPRWTAPDPRVDAVRGCLALEAGPLVYCAESPSPIASVRPLDGVRVRAQLWDSRPVELTLIPYFQRANGDPATMRVWLPVDKSGPDS